MPIKRPPLINKEAYHIVVRAVEGLELFRDKNDYFRMIHNLFEFNDENPVISTYREHMKANPARTVLAGLEGKLCKIFLLKKVKLIGYLFLLY